MRYVIYTRVSSEKQTVENQVNECLEYVNRWQKEGDTVYQFAEPDTSTRLPLDKRKVIQEMLSFIRRGDTVVIYKLDRLARDGRELVNLYYDIEDMGVHLYSLNEQKVTKTLIHLYAAAAMMERDNIQTRTMSGLKRKRANGERVGATLYGFKLDETVLGSQKGSKSEGKPIKLIPCDSESKAVSLMMELHDQGISYDAIIKELNNRGYRNRAGNRWQKTSVYRIVQRNKAIQNPSDQQLASSHR